MTSIDYEDDINKIISILKNDSGLYPAVSIGDGKLRDVIFGEDYQKIIDGTTIENIQIGRNDTMSFDVVSDYDSQSGFDVAKAGEKGTKDRNLPKVEGRIYSWIVGGFIRIFSKDHLLKE